ncbi:MAG: ATP-binding protein [Cytophagales bacterium]|nr:MAG: ATP-binding protein [Cytophagales bacterium]
MVFKDFRFKLIVRIGLLVVSIFFTCWLLQNEANIVSSLICAFFVVLQSILLFHFLNKTQQSILNFLSAIQYDDFSVNYPTKMHTGFTKKLHEHYNNVIVKFRALRTEKESNLQFYQTFIHQIDFGIVAFNTLGEIKIINNAAQRLLKTYHSKNISSIAISEPILFEILHKITPYQKKLVKISLNSEQVSVSISAIEIISKGEKIKLISIQNIQQALEENEMEVWQNMIKVLTHEIMNSLTPITSLAATVADEMNQKNIIYLNENEVSEVSSNDMILALTTIKKRSEGLLHFIEDFRNLTQIPTPKPQLFFLKLFFDNLLLLFKNEIENKKIVIHTILSSENIKLFADEMLIEQVMINVLKNALESFILSKHENKIEIKAFYNAESKIEICVFDNGMGINPEILQKIYTPFYSTKKSGTGIGLSISKQIMRLHNGNIKISSEINKGTLVRLIF